MFRKIVIKMTTILEGGKSTLTTILEGGKSVDV
jgi:hypothetical protein